MSFPGSEVWSLLALIIAYSVGGTNLVFAADSTDKDIRRFSIYDYKGGAVQILQLFCVGRLR